MQLLCTNRRAGDLLVLTKPIGIGILATAGKAGALTPEQDEALYRTMSTLNNLASKLAVELGARCATDITGFGLLGHALHIARASGVTLHLSHAQVPVLDGAREALIAGFATPTGKTRRSPAAVQVLVSANAGSVQSAVASSIIAGSLLQPFLDRKVLVETFALTPTARPLLR